MIPGKYLFREIDERAGHSDLPLLSVSRYLGVVPRINLTDDLSRAEDLSNYKVCAHGDIVVNRMSAYQGAMGMSSHAGLVSPDYMVLRPGPLVYGKFLHYLFRSAWFTGEVVQRLRGIGSVGLGNVRTPRINPDEFGAIPIPLPPLQEQQRIANFLDVETGKIDDLLSKKRRLINLMNERIDSDVLQHVGASNLVRATTGVPALPIRRLLTKVVRPAIAGFGVVTAYRDGQVTQRESRRAEGYTLTVSAEPQGQHVLAGDVVVHGLDGFAGAIGASDANGNCSPVYHVCVPKNDGDARFLGRLLRLLALQGYLGNFAISTRERAVDFRNWDLFGRIPIPVAPTAQQREIGNRISQMSPLREAVERSEVLAAERRQALITAAVTGQFDVSTASGRNVTDGVTA
ncbi:restriction endonuclease subunit S [Streptomyces sp. NPDC002952]|uniref:restriction endonuclease subunit S n=1 Tax=Streptomyces sp. NPDC002952 TaxID=3364673 RepID=UPI0036A0246C